MSTPALRAVMQKPVPRPGRGEVLVRVNMRPINPADAMTLAGALCGSVPALLANPTSVFVEPQASCGCGTASQELAFAAQEANMRQARAPPAGC